MKLLSGQHCLNFFPAYLSLRALRVAVQELRDVGHDGLLVGGGVDVDVLRVANG